MNIFILDCCRVSANGEHTSEPEINYIPEAYGSAIIYSCGFNTYSQGGQKGSQFTSRLIKNMNPGLTLSKILNNTKKDLHLSVDAGDIHIHDPVISYRSGRDQAQPENFVLFEDKVLMSRQIEILKSSDPPPPGILQLLDDVWENVSNFIAAASGYARRFVSRLGRIFG